VAVAPFGAHPTSCYPRYAYDRSHLREYVTAAQSGAAALEKYLEAYVRGGEEAYLELIGAGRVTKLAAWSRSTEEWQELFT
jgi:glutaconate CoA-transferase subunit A